VPIFATSSEAVFSVSPDGRTVAWIEWSERKQHSGPLRVSPLADLGPRGPALLDDAMAASWSPDGASLLATVHHADGTAIVVIDVRTAAIHPLPLSHVDGAVPPIWLDDHRIAARSDDLSTYHWLGLRSGEHGDLVDPKRGSVFELTRSPRDGTLAFRWNTRDS